MSCIFLCSQAYYVEATGYFPGSQAESSVCSDTIPMPANKDDQAVCVGWFGGCQLGLVVNVTRRI